MRAHKKAEREITAALDKVRTLAQEHAGTFGRDWLRHQVPYGLTLDHLTVRDPGALLEEKGPIIGELRSCLEDLAEGRRFTFADAGRSVFDQTAANLIADQLGISNE